MQRVSAVLALCALLAACAAPAPERRSPFRDPGLTATVASQSLAAGRTTRQEARALLGEPESVPFESGHEAWVYRSRSRDERVASEELVLLFDPAGTLMKLRVRTGRGER